MDKKVVFITGAAKGIGAAIAREFSKNNYDIILHYHTSKDIACELKNELEREFSISVLLVQADLSIEEEINNMVKKVISKYPKIDALINNASLSMDCDITEKTKEQFMKVLEVNVVAPFLLIKALAPHLENGTIVNISSTDAEDTGNILNMDYCASKAGLNSLTKTCSLRFSNIRILGVSPNWVRTEAILEMDQDYLQNELNRIGQKNLIEPSEVARQVFSLTQDNEVKNGSIIRIEGEIEYE